MLRHIVRRILVVVPTLVGASILIFATMRIIPGDPAQVILGGEGMGGYVKPIQIETLREELGLTKPLVVQYLDWMGGVIRGDFGRSLWYGSSVATEIGRRAPITFQLVLMGIVVGWILGLPIGILSAVYRESITDHALRVGAVLLLAVPNFWIATMIILVGVLVFGWLPPTGTHLVWIDPVGNMTQMMWPALIIGGHEAARVARMTRSSLLEVIREDYIRTAWSKGLSAHIVYIRHALKNALIPVITLSSLYFGVLLGGTVVLESIFSMPGLGLALLESVKVRDYPMVQTLMLFLVATFAAINLAVDILYTVLDPRIRRL